MYKAIIRPILFCFSPEFIHKTLVWKIKWLFRIPGVYLLVKKLYTIEDKSLERKVFGLTFKNPVGFAAGFDKNAEVFNEFGAFGFSFIEIGTVTPNAQPGNPKPRSFRVTNDKGLINRMGINNKGVQEVVKNLGKRRHKLIIGGNIGKNSITPNESAVDDYVYCFNALYDHVDYFVVNLSCPNVKDLRKLQEKEHTIRILNAMMAEMNKKVKPKPVLLKISPDLNDNQLDDTIEIVIETGIDGIVATNTTTSREGLETPVEKLQEIGDGGLSGKPLSKRSTEIIKYIANKTDNKLPIIGVGGIMTPEDAIEKLEAGASLIQVYTGFIYEGPGFVKRINKALRGGDGRMGE